MFFCLDFTIATQQNTGAYSEKTFLEKKSIIKKKKVLLYFPENLTR